MVNQLIKDQQLGEVRSTSQAIKKRSNGHKPTPAKAPRQSFTPISSLITRDERLRKSIQETLTRTRARSSEEFQFKLSKVLYEVEHTDTGNAIRLAARYGHLIHYVPEPDKWFIYNAIEGRWQEDTSFQVMAFAKRTAAYIDMEHDCIPLPTDKEHNPLVLPALSPLETPNPAQQAIIDQFQAYEKDGKELLKWALLSRSKVKLLAMIELLKDEPGITVAKSRFDTDNYLLNCQNGVLDLHTGEVLPHKAEYLMMRLAPVDAVPNAPCPQWLAFHDKITLGRKGLVIYLQKLAGMGLCGEQLEDVFNVFYGTGSNGKGVWKETIRAIYGDYACPATVNMFMERSNDAGDFEMAGLDGIRFVFKDETKQGRKLDEELVKTAVGRDPIRACFKFKDYFTFLPKFTVILSTNHRPIITGTDNGIWRRVKLVPWEHNFDNDPGKRAKEEVLAALKEESAGILWWAFQGLLMVLSDLKTYGSIQIPDEIKLSTQQYRENSDVIGAFMAECCIIESNAWVKKATLYQRYRTYMDESGSHPLNMNNFNEEMRKRGIDEHNTRQRGRHWLKLRLRTDYDTPLPDETDSPTQEPAPGSLDSLPAQEFAQEPTQEPLPGSSAQERAQAETPAQEPAPARLIRSQYPPCNWCHSKAKVRLAAIPGLFSCIACNHIFDPLETQGEQETQGEYRASDSQASR